MKLLRLAVLIGMSVFTVSCAENAFKSTDTRLIEEGFNRLMAGQIEEVLSGNTMHMEVSGTTYYVFIGADGSLKGKNINSAGKESKVNTGTWEVNSKDDLYCDQWSHFTGGIDCDRVYVNGDEIVLVNLHGTTSSRGEIEKGNSRGL